MPGLRWAGARREKGTLCSWAGEVKVRELEDGFGGDAAGTIRDQLIKRASRSQVCSGNRSHWWGILLCAP